MCVSQLAETFNDSLCISISNGVHRACGKYFDFSAIAILTPDSPIIFAQSPWFEIPSDIIQEAISNNPHCYTWGEIAERFYGGDPNDPHKIVTRGKLSRLDTFVAGIRTAIMQIPWEKYPSSPPQAAAPAI